MSISAFFLRLLCHCFVFLCYFAALKAHSQQLNSHDEHLHIGPAPDWVNEKAPELAEVIPVDKISNGVFYQWLDKQIKVEQDGSKSYYSRYTETVTNQTGVEQSSQINIEFDPSYQKLVLNKLNVIRDGKTTNRLNSAQLSVFSRETDLRQQIYNGDLTLNILMDDIQQGDTIDYSYTRYGSNPVYQGIFSFIRTLNWSVPVAQQNIRILWGKSTPLNIDTPNIDLVVDAQQRGNFIEYNLDLKDADIVKLPSETPGWHRPYGRVHFNEINNWAEVVNWAEPMYQFGPIDPAIERIATQIKYHSTSVKEQVAAALKYTQEKIRYVGLEMGENSHFPTPPEQTLALKYGDCKDKTSLLLSILQALDIKAYPALVNTKNSKLLLDYPAGVNLFNHVIVWLELEDQQFWLDPTLSNQKGNLESLYQPDYGYALILKQGNNQLTSMQKDESHSYTRITESYQLPKDIESAVTLTVDTKYKGYEAIRMLTEVEQNGKNTIAKDYEVYYQRTYPGLVQDAELQVEEHDSSGIVVFKESYKITDFWTLGDEHWEADFYPTEVRDALLKPKQSKRDAPLSFDYPNNIHHVIKLQFEEDDWNFDTKAFVEDNDFFYYTSNVNFKDNTLTLSYAFQSKIDHIPQEKISEYLSARKRVRDDAYYGILKYKDKPADEEETILSTVDLMQDWLWVLSTVYVLGIFFIITSWQLEARKRPQFPDAHFYPIKVSKFIFLSVITFGIYDSYWMYRNWKAIKAKNNEDIMPFWRGIFVVFWIYPMFEALKQDSEQQYQKNKVTAPKLAAVLAFTYLLAYVLTELIDNSYASILFLATPLLLIPFVRYIEIRNQQASPEAIQFNSKWRARHIIGTLLFAPLILLIFAQQTPFIPNDAVVTQSQIWERDLKFFYRQKLLPVDEKIHYFYSDAFWSVKEDGNGFTDNRVFSYWQEQDAGLQKEIALFEDIESIDVKFSDSDLENTIITITRHDESDFMLFVSAIDEKDKLFVDALKKRWQEKRVANE